MQSLAKLKLVSSSSRVDPLNHKSHIQLLAQVLDTFLYSLHIRLSGTRDDPTAGEESGLLRVLW